MKYNQAPIKDNTILIRNSKIQFSRIDQEVILLSPNGANYVKINEIGAIIWELLENPLSYIELVNFLIKEFDVKKQECEIDTKSFLNEAIQNQIIIMKNGK